ncbi:MAG TPA: M23 family metallopeptidase [Pyrinomonadaceae bacterium]|nr:M23 family metallopeptidase [Pyrinomonadaceae bacterium]
MTKNGKYFTFLLKQSSNSRIFIRRIEVPKRFTQNVLLCSAFFIFVSLLGGGLYGMLSSAISQNIDLASTIANPAITQLSGNIPTTRQSIDYSRPDASDDFSMNSGGPVDPDEVDSDSAELEQLIKSIQAKTNPSYIPAIWAHMGKINNEFGFRRNPFGGRTYEFHAGMDIDGERGDMVVAPGNGTVVEAGWKGGYGNMIEIDHGNGLTTRYGHLSKIDVAAGDGITRGQLIGLIGSTGRSTGPHLHYELRVNDHPINPRFFLPPEPTEIRKLTE